MSQSRISIKGVFFDRDGTLSRVNPQKTVERDHELGSLIGIEDFTLSKQLIDEIFHQVLEMPEFKSINSMAQEDLFWQTWYRKILEEYGLRKNAENLAIELNNRFCYFQRMELYPETLSVIQTLKNHGFKLGVISNTFPSLERSLNVMGIGEYFDVFVASSLVSVGKPHPRIFEVALDSLGVTAGTSIFVDDLKLLSDSAREQGFHAFHIDRTQKKPDFKNWTFSTLLDLLKFLNL